MSIVNDIYISGYVLRRKHDGNYLDASGWSNDRLPKLYSSPSKIKSLYKIRPMDIFPRSVLEVKQNGAQFYYNKYNCKLYPDKTKELEAFAEKEFVIVKMEISTKELP